MKQVKLWFLCKFMPKAYRYKIYQWMFEHLSARMECFSASFCTLLAIYCTKHREYEITAISQLPELLDYEPKKHGVYWFDKDPSGQQIRLQILKEILLNK